MSPTPTSTKVTHLQLVLLRKTFNVVHLLVPYPKRSIGTADVGPSDSPRTYARVQPHPDGHAREGLADLLELVKRTRVNEHSVPSTQLSQAQHMVRQLPVTSKRIEGRS